MPLDSVAYVERTADHEAIAYARHMEYITILEPRQQGKTSLIHRLCSALSKDNYVVAYVSADSLPSGDESGWYQELGTRILKQSKLSLRFTALPGNSVDWRYFLRDLAQHLAFQVGANCKLIVALDEVASLSYPWGESFFKTLREIYNSRVKEPEFRLLTFILAGSVSPHSLIRNPAVSPFNIAQRVRLHDFTIEEVRCLASHLPLSSGQLDQISERLYYWTDGQPFLTQVLCAYLSRCQKASISQVDGAVDDAVNEFLQNDINHLPAIANTLQRNPRLLSCAQRFLAIRAHFLPASSPEQLELAWVLGVIKPDEEYRCRIRNRIYERAFPQLRSPVDESTSLNTTMPSKRNIIQLQGGQALHLSQALLKAYDLNRFDQMLRFRLNKNREDIALGRSFEEIVFRVISRAESEGWIPNLVLAARESNPGSVDLLTFAQQIGLAPTGTPSQTELERIINETNSFLDIAVWRERLGRIETRVCRVEIRDRPYGTGFLVGPDLVMTNYHVVEEVIEAHKGYKPEDIVVRFDYKRLPDGNVLNQGAVFRVRASDWLVDSSPYDPVDLQPQPKQGVPQADRLDYALLRLEGAPGSEPVGQSYSSGDEKRGWINFTAESHDFISSPALYIVQHPQGEPLKLALDTRAIMSINENRTRITYRTNTEPGSSGSPCFNKDWELVALHHGGDPNMMPAWNEGIPFAAIMALLRERGILQAIGGHGNNQAEPGESERC